MLRTQEEQNRAVTASNTRITSEIVELRSNNSALRAHAKELQDGNKIRRAELRTLHAKFGMARDFIQASLVHTDDSKVPALAVLVPKAPKRKARRHRAFMEVAAKSKNVDANVDEQDDGEDDDAGDDAEDEEDDGASASFLALSSRVKRAASKRAEAAAEEETPRMAETEVAATVQEATANPKDLLEVLSRGVTNLQREEKASEARLKAMFLSNFQAGIKRHTALVGQQRSLNATHVSLVSLQSQLRTADAHLEGTRAMLEKQLRGLGLFAQRLAHLALAPLDEVPRLLKALPTAVTAAPAPAK